MNIIKAVHRNRTFFDRISFGIGLRIKGKYLNINFPESISILGFDFQCIHMDDNLLYLFLENKNLNGFRLLKNELVQSYPDIEDELLEVDPLGETNFIPDKVWKNRTIGTWHTMKYKKIPKFILEILDKSKDIAIDEFTSSFPDLLFEWVQYYTISQVEIALDIPIRAGIDFSNSDSFQSAFSKEIHTSTFAYHPTVPVPRGIDAFDLSTSGRDALVRANIGVKSSYVGDDKKSKRFCFRMDFHDRVTMIAYIKHVPTPKKEGDSVSKYWLGRFEKRYSSEREFKKTGASKIKERFGSNRFSNYLEFSDLLSSMCDEHFSFLKEKLANHAITLTEKERYNAIATMIGNVCTHRSSDVIRLLVTGKQQITPADIKAFKLRRSQLLKAESLDLLDRTGPKDSIFTIKWSSFGSTFAQQKIELEAKS